MFPGTSNYLAPEMLCSDWFYDSKVCRRGCRKGRGVGRMAVVVVVAGVGGESSNVAVVVGLGLIDLGSFHAVPSCL